MQTRLCQWKRELSSSYSWKMWNILLMKRPVVKLGGAQRIKIWWRDRSVRKGARGQKARAIPDRWRRKKTWPQETRSVKIKWLQTRFSQRPTKNPKDSLAPIGRESLTRIWRRPRPTRPWVKNLRTQASVKISKLTARLRAWWVVSRDSVGWNHDSVGQPTSRGTAKIFWSSKKDFVRSAILTSRSEPNTANIAKAVFRLLTIIASGSGTALAKETNGYSLCSYFLKFSRWSCQSIQSATIFCTQN